MDQLVTTTPISSSPRDIAPVTTATTATTTAHKTSTSTSSRNMMSSGGIALRRKPPSSTPSPSRRGRRRRGRAAHTWQLPESNIEEYVKWIENKPSEERSSLEDKLLWRYQRRSRGDKGNPETTTLDQRQSLKDYIGRLEAKEDRSATENQILQTYYKRRNRGERKEDWIVWKREPKASTTSILSNMTHLQERMDEMGLSSDKLRDVCMDDSK